jgi:hypothetical protein
MSLLYGVSQVMHRVKLKLYPNYLPGGEGTFLARTDSEATISVEQNCAAMRDRGGFKGDFDDLVHNIKAFFDEAAYQLCDGFTVNFGLFSLYFNVGGVFKTEHDTPDPKNHPLSLRIRVHSVFAKLVNTVHIEIEGFANTSGCIDMYLDEEVGDDQHMFLPGNMFVINGQKIKIAGDDPSVGLYFVPVDNPAQAVKVNRIIENHPHKLIGIAPQTGFAQNRIEVRTQFAGAANNFLKTPRIITSPFILEEA